MPTAEVGTRALVVNGRGFGHGVGMGQWGARAMAASGQTWQRIVGHYYPGVAISAPTRSGIIRVSLANERVVEVSSAQPFAARVSGHSVATTSTATPYLRARREGNVSIIERARASGGPWTGVARTGGSVVFGPGAAAIEVFRSSAMPRWYRGAIEASPNGASLTVINHVALDGYLMGVVPREMPAEWPLQALEAQAVAARSYAVRVMQVARAHGARYDICATTRCQVYGGAARMGLLGWPIRLEDPRSDAAVRATSGVVMTWAGQPVLAEYSSSSGGATADGHQPYLRAVPDGADAGSPYHSWSRSIPFAEIERRWGVGPLNEVTVVERDGPRARTVEIRGSSAVVRVPAWRFQAAFGLRSRWFWLGGAPSAPASAPQPARPRPLARYRFSTDMGTGARGAAVIQLQHRLLAEGWFPDNSPITGYFGAITRDSLERYQRWNHLPVTGFLGPRTRARLNA